MTLICEHSDKGALGIVLNKPLGMKLGEVLSQMKLEPAQAAIGGAAVLRGGPVHTGPRLRAAPAGRRSGTPPTASPSSIQVTTSRDVLAAMARGEGPQDAFIALGYAGWEPASSSARCSTTPGCRVPMNERIVFELPYEERWQAAWQMLGVDSSRVSLVAGHA